MRPIACRAAVLIAFAFAGPVSAADVDVTIESASRGPAVHGYAEIQVRVVNRSAEPHEVRLQYPKSSYGYGDVLRSVTRTVKVDAGASLRVPLFYPERITPYGGDGLSVEIDGREWGQPIPVGGPRGMSSRTYGGARTPLVLYSNAVDPRVPDQFRFALHHESVRSDVPVRLWSAHWLGYTRYDGIAITDRDLADMPADVKAALVQYVECGGSLLAIGPRPQLPANWKSTQEPGTLLRRGTPGFGIFLAVDDFSILQFGRPEVNSVVETWRQSLSPWQRTHAPAEANRIFPVVDDVGVPVKGLVAVMFLFAIIIGPLNMIVLARKKRKLWLYWTVPLVSFLTCLLVLGYMVVSEGWSGHARTEGFTILDENSRRASTIGWSGYYAPIVPRGGLHFGPDTEVNHQNGDDMYSYRRSSGGSSYSMDWSDDQHLASGWIAPRVPSHFSVRRSELRRERVAIEAGADGLPEAVNGLGANVVSLSYRDAQGSLFRADNIAAGERGSLKPVPRVAPPMAGMTSLRQVYSGEWHGLVDRLKNDGVSLLAPRTYLAVLDGAPFMDEGMPGASVRRGRSVVYGILKEGADGR